MISVDDPDLEVMPGQVVTNAKVAAGHDPLDHRFGRGLAVAERAGVLPLDGFDLLVTDVARHVNRGYIGRQGDGMIATPAAPEYPGCQSSEQEEYKCGYEERQET